MMWEHIKAMSIKDKQDSQSPVDFRIVAASNLHMHKIHRGY